MMRASGADAGVDLGALLSAERGRGRVAAATLASYRAEALASDAISSIWRVVHSPRVAVRSSPNVADKNTIGARRCGEVVAVSERRGGWLRLCVAAAATPGEQWMLADPEGTAVAHLGELLERVEEPAGPELIGPGAFPPIAGGALGRVASPRGRSYPIAPELSGGVGGGCAGGGAWRALLGPPGSRWSVREARGGEPSWMATAEEGAALRAPRLLLVLLGADARADPAGAAEDDSLAGALTALSAEARVLLLSLLDAADEWPAAGALDEAVGAFNEAHGAAAASRRVFGGSGGRGADALRLAAEEAMREGGAPAGCWLRLPPMGAASPAPRPRRVRSGSDGRGRAAAVAGGRPSASNDDYRDDDGPVLEENVQAGPPEADEPLPARWDADEAAAWVEARRLAAKAGARLGCLVSGPSARARALAAWLKRGGVDDVAHCGRGATRTVERGGAEARWLQAHRAAGIDRPTLWLMLKWALTTPWGAEQPWWREPGSPSGDPLCDTVVALAQLAPAAPPAAMHESPSDPEAWTRGGLVELVCAAAEAAAGGARLMVAPEAFLQGYEVLLSASRWEAAIERGRAVSMVGGIARKHRIGIVVGYIERASRASGVVYNSALLVGPDGEEAYHARKTVLPDDELDAGIAPSPAGGRPCSSPLPWLGGARVGVLICADIELPEVAGASAVGGADLLVVVACAFVCESAEPPTWLHAVAHAARFGVPIIYTNQGRGVTGGTGFGGGPREPTIQGGGSRVIAPDGRDAFAFGEHEHSGVGFAVLGSALRQRLSWSGASLMRWRETLRRASSPAPSPAIAMMPVRELEELDDEYAADAAAVALDVVRRSPTPAAGGGD